VTPIADEVATTPRKVTVAFAAATTTPPLMHAMSSSQRRVTISVESAFTPLPEVEGGRPPVRLDELDWTGKRRPECALSLRRLRRIGTLRAWTPTMPYKRGEVVLALFPYTDLSGAKKRPAVVVQDEDVETGFDQQVIAQITSKLARTGADESARQSRFCRWSTDGPSIGFRGRHSTSSPRSNRRPLTKSVDHAGDAAGKHGGGKVRAVDGDVLAHAGVLRGQRRHRRQGL